MERKKFLVIYSAEYSVIATNNDEAGKLADELFDNDLIDTPLTDIFCDDVSRQIKEVD